MWVKVRNRSGQLLGWTEIEEKEKEGRGVTRSAIGPGSIALGSHGRCAAALTKLHGTSSFGRVSAPCGVTIPDVAGFAA